MSDMVHPASMTPGIDNALSTDALFVPSVILLRSIIIPDAKSDGNGGYPQPPFCCWCFFHHHHYLVGFGNESNTFQYELFFGHGSLFRGYTCVVNGRLNVTFRNGTTIVIFDVALIHRATCAFEQIW